MNYISACISSVLIIIGCLSSQAQTKFGIHGGLSTTELKTDEITLTNSQGINELKLQLEKANYGFHFGIFVLAKSDFLFIKPQIQFNSESVDFSVKDIGSSDSVSKILSETYQRIDIPIQLGVTLGPLRVGVGPVGHFNLNTCSEITDEYDEYSVQFSDFTFGYILGAGLDIWNFHIDVGYEGNFEKFGDHIVFGGNEYEFDSSPSRFIASVGISF